MSWMKIAKAFEEGIPEPNNKRGGKGQSFRLNTGEIVTTASCVHDERNVHGLSQSGFLRRLAVQRIRDPEELFSPSRSAKNGSGDD